MTQFNRGEVGSETFETAPWKGCSCFIYRVGSSTITEWNSLCCPREPVGDKSFTIKLHEKWFNKFWEYFKYLWAGCVIVSAESFSLFFVEVRNKGGLSVPCLHPVISIPMKVYWSPWHASVIRLKVMYSVKFKMRLSTLLMIKRSFVSFNVGIMFGPFTTAY